MKPVKDKWLIWPALFAIYFIWGTTYLAGTVALSGLKPFMISALRYLTTALLLTLWIRFKRIRWPDKRHWGVLTVSGILMLSGGSGLVIVGEQYISSGAVPANPLNIQHIMTQI